MSMTHTDLDLAALAARPLVQVTAFTRWVGAGRKLTQTGRVTLADARELVTLLETGDELDRAIGDRVYRTKSSDELRGLSIVVLWARAVGLVRVVTGRLVPVKKNARLLDRPRDLWAAMFESFGQLGEAVSPRGYLMSLMVEDFADGVAVLLADLADRGGSIRPDEANELIWSTLVRRYRLDGATDEQRRIWRHSTDHDVRATTDLLVEFGALAVDESGALRRTELANWALRRNYGAGTGDPVAQILISLLHTEPVIWRRLLVPAAIRLDRLHRLIQAAMGWDDYHLHVFTQGAEQYGKPDDELEHRDERKATLRDVASQDGESFGYEYDFGDSWDHEITVERLTVADPDGRYPICVGGARACPPEDCGGTAGYASLVDILADADHPEHQDMLDWLGLAKGSDFDPARFDLDDANRRLESTMQGALGTG
jgi:hypothetical protein